jgi:exodeoxyribonuclease VII large subunit
MRSYAFRQPLELIRREERRLDDLCEELAEAGRKLLPDRKRSLDVISARLEALSPRNVLARGYSITLLEKNGKIVKQASQVTPGDMLNTLLWEGDIRSTVDSASPGEDDGSKEQ